MLLGKTRDRILQNGHDRLSTVGIGDLDNNEWRSLFRQLIALGYLYSDVDNFGALKMTPACKPLLAGEQQLQLRKFARPARAVKPAKLATSSTLQPGDEALFEALRLHRSELAKQQGVPPYVILHDKTLVAICEHRPQTSETLALIPGIGERKLELYGAGLIELIRQHSPANSAATTTADLEPG